MDIPPEVLIPALSGLAGAVIGGLFTLAAASMALWAQARAVAKVRIQEVRGAARMVRSDIWAMQSYIALAIKNRAWEPDYDDVWNPLITPETVALLATSLRFDADGQKGWGHVGRARREVNTVSAAWKRGDPPDVEAIKDSFWRMEKGRKALEGIGSWKFKDHPDCQTVRDAT